MQESSLLPDFNSWQDWTTTELVKAIKPVKDEVTKLTKRVDDVPSEIFKSISRNSLRNMNVIRLGEILNNPHAIIREKLQQALSLDSLKFYQLIRAFRDSKATAVSGILDDYLDRVDSIELAISALLGKRLPIVEAISKDIHVLLGKGDEKEFPAAILSLLDGVSGTLARVLSELGVIASRHSGAAPSPLDLEPGHFYDWVSCNTSIDQEALKGDKARRRQQQKLRYTMLKVILTYIEDHDLSPSRFKSSAAADGEPTSIGGFPLSSASAKSALDNGEGLIRAYAGLCAAAFEHLFVSARPLSAAGADASSSAAELYHDLPFSLKLQRPDLSRLAFAKPGYSAFGADKVDLELDSEFLAMKLATNAAVVSSGLVRTAINCVANGIWEISPNNPPLIETIASLIAIPIYEIEKAIIYDVFRRFRIYVTDSSLDTSHEFVLMHASIRVPDFSGKGATEKDLRAVIALACTDADLLAGLKQLIPTLPLCLDEAREDAAPDTVTRMLQGMMKDALAVCYVASA